MSQLAKRIVAQQDLARDQDNATIKGKQNPKALLFLTEILLHALHHFATVALCPDPIPDPLMKMMMKKLLHSEGRDPR